MPRGRKPKPAEVRKAEGNPGKRPIPENIPQAQKGTPTCPKELKGSVKKVWTRIVKELHQMGILYRVDWTSLAVLAANVSRFLEAEEAINREGLIVISPSGYKIQNPNIGISNTATKNITRLIAEFGLSPSARTRIVLEEETEENKTISTAEWKKKREARLKKAANEH